MTIYYRDNIGVVVEEIHAQELDFCGGKMYYFSDEIDVSGNYVDREIDLSALVRIVG